MDQIFQQQINGIAQMAAGHIGMVQPEKLIASVLESELEGSESRAAVLKLLEPRLEEQVPQPAVSP